MTRRLIYAYPLRCVLLVAAVLAGATIIAWRALLTPASTTPL